MVGADAGKIAVGPKRISTQYLELEEIQEGNDEKIGRRSSWHSQRNLRDVTSKHCNKAMRKRRMCTGV
jgi:hypothetical protein